MPNTLRLINLRSGLVAGSLFASMLFASLASAFPLVLIDETFETYTTVPVGIGDLNPGDGNPNDWLDQSNGTSTRNVIAGSSTDGRGANERILKLNATGADDESARIFRDFENPVNLSSGTPLVTATFKLRLDGGPNDQVFTFGGLNRLNRITALRASGTNQLRYLRSDDGPGDAPSWITVSTAIFEFNNTDWYEVSMTADLQTQKWEFSVTNLSDASNSFALDDLWFNVDQEVITAFTTRNRSGSFGSTDISLDDILVTAIPEPGTWALLFGLGALAISGLYRRRG